MIYLFTFLYSFKFHMWYASCYMSNSIRQGFVIHNNFISFVCVCVFAWVLVCVYDEKEDKMTRNLIIIFCLKACHTYVCTSHPPIWHRDINKQVSTYVKLYIQNKCANIFITICLVNLWNDMNWSGYIQTLTSSCVMNGMFLSEWEYGYVCLMMLILFSYHVYWSKGTILRIFCMYFQPKGIFVWGEVTTWHFFYVSLYVKMKYLKITLYYSNY